MKRNPFPEKSDRWAIWDMLVDRDIKAFISKNWEMVASDFIEESFMGIDAGGHRNPDAWLLRFPTLKSYKEEWLHQAEIFSSTLWAEDSGEALFRITTLRDIEINGDAAMAHKKFFGFMTKGDGEKVAMEWQTLYRCRKVGDRWKIAGFTGYMSHYLGLTPETKGHPIQIPNSADQHKTAGPYSPVLEVDPRKLVVISGQAAIDKQGTVIGASIEEQSAYTLDNCKRQLAFAGCSFDNVFKVNVYLTDLDNWPRFNEVYKTYFSSPLPVRTAVGVGLLAGLLVEIEMWAVKS